MKIIPAIFIQNGKVVSLYKGAENKQKKVYAKAPKTYAKFFSDQGARTIFVVDLDGDQQDRIHEIRNAMEGELWWAGRVREMEHLTWLLANGADKVVLGQSAEPIFEEAIKTFGSEKIMVGLQFKHYDEAPDLCEKMGESGFGEIIMKDLNAEGTLVQPNFDLMEKCVYFSGLKVYASGGIGDDFHVELMQRAGVEGVIIARAFYENQLSLAQLISRYES
jgi:phosphoribosylformimino-5-aminoimidazole carboxamide ribotide isomerase